MISAPAPLLPADVDLRSYDWFPFFHKRLRQSAFWKRASDAACRISVDFWSEAYEQVPAGSLPDDDHLLSDWAGFGRRDLTGWQAVKAEVMSAWTLCSDGRWYHPTLCDVAAKAWSEKLVHLWERECERLRKANARRAKDGLDPLSMPPKPGTVGTDTEPLSAGHPTPSEGHPADVRGIPLENALKGTGTLKEDTSSLRSEVCSPTPPAAEVPTPELLLADANPGRPAKAVNPRQHAYPVDAFATWYAKFPRKKARPEAERAFRRIIAADDTPFETLMAGIDAFWPDNPDVKFWPYPAVWLNGRRWLDEPTRSAAPSQMADCSGHPKIDFGGGVCWPETAVRDRVARWRHDPASWPEDRLGPPPDAPNCRVPTELLRMAA